MKMKWRRIIGMNGDYQRGMLRSDKVTFCYGKYYFHHGKASIDSFNSYGSLPKSNSEFHQKHGYFTKKKGRISPPEIVIFRSTNEISSGRLDLIVFENGDMVIYFNHYFNHDFITIWITFKFQSLLLITIN